MKRFNYNAKNIFKDKFKDLKEARDFILAFSIIWTGITMFLMYEGSTCLFKLCLVYLVLIVSWYYAIKLNHKMRLIKKYCKSLYIRPSLEEEQAQEELHNKAK